MADVDKLKERIVDYVMHTPGNSNPSVLRTMLDLLASSGGQENVIEEIQVAGVTIPPVDKVVNITNLDGVDISNATIVVEGEQGQEPKPIGEVINNIASSINLVSDSEDGLAPKLEGNTTQLLEEGDNVLIMRQGAPL